MTYDNGIPDGLSLTQLPQSLQGTELEQVDIGRLMNMDENRTITETDTLTLHKSILPVSRTMYYLQDKVNAWSSFCKRFFGEQSWVSLDTTSWENWIDKNFSDPSNRYIPICHHTQKCNELLLSFAAPIAVLGVEYFLSFVESLTNCLFTYTGVKSLNRMSTQSNYTNLTKQMDITVENFCSTTDTFQALTDFSRQFGGDCNNSFHASCSTPHVVTLTLAKALRRYAGGAVEMVDVELKQIYRKCEALVHALLHSSDQSKFFVPNNQYSGESQLRNHEIRKLLFIQMSGHSGNIAYHFEQDLLPFWVHGIPTEFMIPAPCRNFDPRSRDS
jgi:hypothetical protein